MHDQRPVHLNLLVISFPVTAIASIFHRISGVLLFLWVPVAIWMLDLSLTSEAGFNTIANMLKHLWVQLLFFVALTSLWYHMVAGLRHLLMDMGLGESKNAGKLSAWLVMLFTLIGAACIGGFLW